MKQNVNYSQFSCTPLHSDFNPQSSSSVTGSCVFGPHDRTHNEQQSAGPVCCLARVSSVTGGSNPAVFPGKTPVCCHSYSSSSLSLFFFTTLCASAVVPGELTGLRKQSFLLQVFFFFCTQTVARERRHLQDGLEFIEMDLLQLSSLAYTSKSSFLLYPFMLSPSLRPCHPPGPQAGPVSTVEQAADSTLTSVEDGRMRSSDRREGGKEGREERGTNERDSHSRGLSLHLQITAPLTLFDIYPK